MKLKWSGLICLLWVTACNGQGVISDPTTPHYIPEMSQVPEQAMLVENHLDEMDQGQLEYASSEWGKFVVITNNQKLSRGDVVYIKTPMIQWGENQNVPETKILRVVGLPGEKLEVKKGNIFINGAQLEVFYGHSRKSGMDKKEYQEMAKANGLDPNEFNEWFEKDYKETDIPSDHYFLIGDNWWRSIDSFQFGPVASSNIAGKVIGYLK